MSASERWSSQPDLFSVPHSRWNAPDTSRQAAESISLERVSEVQHKILTLLKIHGPMSDQQLVERFDGCWPSSATDQSVRSRRGELVRKGLVVDTGRRSTTKYGRSCVVWKAS